MYRQTGLWIDVTHLLPGCEGDCECVRLCTTMDRPIMSQTFRFSETTWNVALPVLLATTNTRCPASALLGVVYTSPQLQWERRGMLKDFKIPFNRIWLSLYTYSLCCTIYITFHTLQTNPQTGALWCHAGQLWGHPPSPPRHIFLGSPVPSSPALLLPPLHVGSPLLHHGGVKRRLYMCMNVCDVSVLDEGEGEESTSNILIVKHLDSLVNLAHSYSL